MDLSTELSENMTDAFLLKISDLNKVHEITLVYGDLMKIILAVRDYAEIMDQVCDECGLEGFHKALYQLRARKLQEISTKLEKSIGFDYDAAMRKCQRKKYRRNNGSDVGEEALILTSRQQKEN